jgi:hypothetical protein
VTGTQPRARLPGPFRRALAWLVSLLPTPPDDTQPRDPLLDGLDDLPPEEREARSRVLYGRSRWGRGNG